jgi:hypothetical protein
MWRQEAVSYPELLPMVPLFGARTQPFELGERYKSSDRNAIANAGSGVSNGNDDIQRMPLAPFAWRTVQRPFRIHVLDGIAETNFLLPCRLGKSGLNDPGNSNSGSLLDGSRLEILTINGVLKNLSPFSPSIQRRNTDRFFSQRKPAFWATNGLGDMGINSQGLEETGSSSWYISLSAEPVNFKAPMLKILHGTSGGTASGSTASGNEAASDPQHKLVHKAGEVFQLEAEKLKSLFFSHEGPPSSTGQPFLLVVSLGQGASRGLIECRDVSTLKPLVLSEAIRKN